jgi:hypothetical protein
MLVELVVVEQGAVHRVAVVGLVRWVVIVPWVAKMVEMVVTDSPHLLLGHQQLVLVAVGVVQRLLMVVKVVLAVVAMAQLGLAVHLEMQLMER